MKSKPLFFEAENLSIAWVRAFLALMEPGVSRITPLVFTLTCISNGQPTETTVIRDELNIFLKQHGKSTINSTANTIFPKSFWNPNKDRRELYDRYQRAFPVIKRLDSQNRYGLYFQRLIAFGQGRKRFPREEVNQLEHIITTYKKGNHRSSALQASVLDPFLDHTDQRRRGFPCLQQISFVPDSETGELEITGFYANQYIVERAYGNYLGLCRLGHFVAHEIGFSLSRMNCITNVAELGYPNKKDLMPLKRSVEEFTMEN